VRIDDAFLPDLGARKKFAASRVPRLADVALDELLSLQPSKLTKKIEGALLQLFSKIFFISVFPTVRKDVTYQASM
jgi:hypothetical protein